MNRHLLLIQQLLGARLPARLKGRIFWSWLELFCLRRSVKRVAGIPLAYPRLNLLRLLFREIFLEQPYYFESTRPDPLVLDCGSNIGLSVIYFKLLYPRARVLAFEPQAHNFEYLQSNVATLSEVTAYNLALWDQDGELDLYEDAEQPGSLIASCDARRLAVRERPVLPQRVACRRLSGYVQEPVDFLKLDIEGAELAVLRELQQAGKLQQIRRMGIEYHHHLDPNSDRLSELLQLLEQAGFGYQLSAQGGRPYSEQDIAVLAYQKSEGSA